MAIAVKATVRVNLAGLSRFRREFESQLAGEGAGPIRGAFIQWAVRYRSFIMERFDSFSKGGGDWPPLKPATIRARRKGKSKKNKGKVTILRDTGTLYAALSPTFTEAPGAQETHRPFGVDVGYGGPHKYPTGGVVTVADIASFHQTGAGHLPVRKIIVSPPQTVINAMKEDMIRALKKVADGSSE